MAFWVCHVKEIRGEHVPAPTLLPLMPACSAWALCGLFPGSYVWISMYESTPKLQSWEWLKWSEVRSCSNTLFCWDVLRKLGTLWRKRGKSSMAKKAPSMRPSKVTSVHLWHMKATQHALAACWILKFVVTSWPYCDYCAKLQKQAQATPRELSLYLQVPAIG